MPSEVQQTPAGKRRTAWQRIRRMFLLYITIPYLTVTVVFALAQRQLMYRPTIAEKLAIDETNGIDVELTTPDGNTLRGWLVYSHRRNPADANKPPLVLYFPGNSLNRAERTSDLREFAKCGFDVLIFDYRGFGDSTGSPGEPALSADALLVWNFARRTLGYQPNRTIIFGESLGGAVALSLWSRTNSAPPQPAALILNSTFASMPQTVQWHYPLFPFQFLLLDRWPSIERIGRVDSDVIVFHGTHDEFVPIAHSRDLARASTHARFVKIPGATHNDIPMTQLREELDSLMSRIERNSIR